METRFRDNKLHHQFIALTKKGVGLHDEIVDIARDREEFLLADLNAQDRRALMRLLAKIHTRASLLRRPARREGRPAVVRQARPPIQRLYEAFAGAGAALETIGYNCRIATCGAPSVADRARREGPDVRLPHVRNLRSARHGRGLWTNCGEAMRNGPCGGVRADGGCEVDPAMRCVWLEARDGMRLIPPRAGNARPACADRFLAAGRSSWIKVIEGAPKSSSAGAAAARTADAHLRGRVSFGAFRHDRRDRAARLRRPRRAACAG